MKFQVHPCQRKILLGMVVLATLYLPVVAQDQQQDPYMSMPIIAMSQATDHEKIKPAPSSVKPQSSIYISEVVWMATSLLGVLFGSLSLLTSAVLRRDTIRAEKRLADLMDNNKNIRATLNKYKSEVLAQAAALKETRAEYDLFHHSCEEAMTFIRQKMSTHDRMISSLSTTRPAVKTPESLIAHPPSEAHDHSGSAPVQGSDSTYESQGLQESGHLATTPNPSSEEEVTQQYLFSLHHSDRSSLRRIAQEELNITPDSEDALLRGTSTLNTQLLQVHGGGSYLLIPHGGRYWLFPTAQTLTGFTTSQPQKGIFDYERQAVSAANLRRPAEVQEIGGGIWEVISKGVVVVPA